MKIGKRISLILLIWLSLITPCFVVMAITEDRLSGSKFSFFKSLYYRLTLREEQIVDNKKLLAQYNFTVANQNKTVKRIAIPKILHHVWLGDKPLPALYAQYIEQCRILNPGWQYKLWTTESVKHFPKEIQDLIEKSSSYHEQSDILRLAILSRYGGLYLDADIKCIGNFDDLVDGYSTVVSIDYAKRRLLNGVIAATPENFLIKDAIEELTEHFAAKYKDFFEYKFDYEDPLKSFHRLAVERTMLPLSKAVLSYDKLELDPNLLVMPLSYCMQPYSPNYIKELKSLFGYYLKRSTGIEFYNYAKCFHNPSPSYSYIDFPKFAFTLGSQFNQPASLLKGVFNLGDEEKFYKYIYNNNYPSIMKGADKPIIPRLVHFTKEMSGNLKTWKAVMSGYKVKEWGQDEQNRLLMRNGLGHLTDRKLADFIVGLIILRDEGGILVRDFSLLPSRNIDDLVYQYSLFLGLKPIQSYRERLMFSDKIIAAQKGNIFIRMLLEKIKHDPKSISSVSMILSSLSEIIIGFYPLDKKLFIFPASFLMSNRAVASYAYYEKAIN